MAKAGELRFVVTTDAKGAIVDMKKITGNIDNIDKNTKKTADSWGKLGKRIAAAISIYAGARLFQNIGKAAIDATETTSKFGVVFRDELTKANEITRELVSSYGFSVTGAEAALSSVGDLAQGLGIASDVSLEMAENTTKFAANLVSFTNVAGGTERAIDALTKAQLGEREMLKAYGIAIYEADVNQRLFLKGQQNLEGAALKAAKAQAVLELAMEQSRNAMGDFARTAESPANLLRVLENRVEDFKVGLGKAITEQTGFKDGIVAINDILADQTLQRGLAEIIGSIVKLASVLVQATAGLIDFLTQSSKARQLKQVVDQTEQLTGHYERQQKAIKDAGISIKVYFDALQKQPEFDRLQELNEIVEEQKQKLKEYTDIHEKSPNAPFIAKAIEKQQAELNKSLLEQAEIRTRATREIMSNASAYGISTDQVNDFRKSLRGDIDTKIKNIETTKKIDAALNDFFGSIDNATKNIFPQHKKALGHYDDAMKKQSIKIPETIDATLEWNDALEENEDQLEGVTTYTATWQDLMRRLQIDKQARETSRLAEKQAEYNASLKETISKSAELVNMLVKFAGISENTANAIFSVSNAFADMFSNMKIGFDAAIPDKDSFKNTISGLTSMVGIGLQVANNIDKIGAAFFGMTGNKAREAAEKFEENLKFMQDRFQELGVKAGDAAETITTMFFTALTEGRVVMEDFNQFYSTMIGNMENGFESLNPWFSGLGENMEMMEELMESAARKTTDFWDKMFRDTIGPLTEFLQTAAGSQEEFTNQVNIAMSTFAAAINSGKSYTEVLLAMKEPFDLLIQSMTESKFVGDETFTALIELQKKVAENEQLVNSIDAFNQLLAASGGLIGNNQEAFDSYVSQTLMNYDKLIDAKFSDQEALLLTAPALQQLQELQEKYGLTVDENTQKLIDEADSLGLFKTDPLDRIVEVLEIIAVQLGATLPEAAESGAQRTAQAFEDLTDKAIKDFERLEKNIEGIGIIDFKERGERNINRQPPLRQESIPGFANGGSMTVPPGFNNDNFLFAASSGEQVTVTPRSQVSQNTNNARQESFTMNANFHNNFTVPIDPEGVNRALLSGLRQGLYKDEIKRELNDAR